MVSIVLIRAGTNATTGNITGTCTPAIFDFILGVNQTGLLSSGTPINLVLLSYTNASDVANVTWQVSMRALQAVSYTSVGAMTPVTGPVAGYLSAWRLTVPANFVAMVGHTVAINVKEAKFAACTL